MGNFSTALVQGQTTYLPIECASLTFTDASNVAPTINFGIGNGTAQGKAGLGPNLVSFRPAAGVNLFALTLMDGKYYTIFCRATNAVNLSMTVSVTVLIHASPPMPTVVDPVANLVFVGATYLGSNNVLLGASRGVAACVAANTFISLLWAPFDASSFITSLSLTLKVLEPTSQSPFPLTSPKLGATVTYYNFTALPTSSWFNTDSYLSAELVAMSQTGKSTTITSGTILRIPSIHAPVIQSAALFLSGSADGTYSSILPDGSSIAAQWLNVFDGTIHDVAWAIGSTPGGQQIQMWTSVPSDACYTQADLFQQSITLWPVELPLCGVLTGLRLLPNEAYYVSVRAASCTGRSVIATSGAIVWDTVPVAVQLVSPGIATATWQADAPFSLITTNVTLSEYLPAASLAVFSTPTLVKLTVCCFSDPGGRIASQVIALSRSGLPSFMVSTVDATFSYTVATGVLTITPRQPLLDGTYTAVITVSTVSGISTSLNRSFIIDTLGPVVPVGGVTVTRVPSLPPGLNVPQSTWCQSSLTAMSISWPPFQSVSPIISHQVCISSVGKSTPCDMLNDKVVEQGRAYNVSGLKLLADAAYSVKITVRGRPSS
jgi:hypothetical protein